MINSHERGTFIYTKGLIIAVLTMMLVVIVSGCTSTDEQMIPTNQK